MFLRVGCSVGLSSRWVILFKGADRLRTLWSRHSRSTLYDPTCSERGNDRGTSPLPSLLLDLTSRRVLDRCGDTLPPSILLYSTPVLVVTSSLPNLPWTHSRGPCESKSFPTLGEGEWGWARWEFVGHPSDRSPSALSDLPLINAQPERFLLLSRGKSLPPLKKEVQVEALGSSCPRPSLESK